MNLYEYKLVVGKIKVKKYEVTDGRTSYKLNASSSNCFEYNDSNNLAKNEMEKVLKSGNEIILCFWMGTCCIFIVQKMTLIKQRKNSGTI